MASQSVPFEAPPAGAFLIALAAGVFALGSTASMAVTCGSDRIEAHGLSAHVYDGDTLRLQDGRKVRLLGINTPEIGRDGKPSEPLAESALDALQSLASPGTRLGLRYDVEQTDRYGRALAHLFLGDGTNLQAHLLSRGLATTLVVPPNEWASDCYAGVESEARGRRAGLWSLSRYQPISAQALPADTRGYALVLGNVVRVGRSSGAIWLNLAPRVALRIPRADLPNFRSYDPSALLGRKLLARGWVQKRRGELRMTVRHPAALELLD